MKNKIIKLKAYCSFFREKGKGKQWQKTPQYSVIYCKNRDHAFKLLSHLNEQRFLEFETEKPIELSVAFLGLARVTVVKENNIVKFNYWDPRRIYEHAYIGNNIVQKDGYHSDFDDQIDYLIETYKIDCEILNEDFEDLLSPFETIHLSYINGNKKQMVEQMADIDIPDFLVWLSEHRSIDRALALIISYFRIKEYYK